MVKLFSKLCIALSIGFLVLFSANIKDYYYRNVTGGNVVRIFNITNTSGGTGFHIKTESGEVYILTNKHVCGLADENDNVIVEQNGHREVRKVLKRYKDHDLCLVTKMKDHSNFIKIAGSATKGEDIIVVGHPGLRYLTLAHGEYVGRTNININSVVNNQQECLDGKIIPDPIINILFNKLVCVKTYISDSISSPIYGGNSGSPVVNKWGKLIGVVFAGNRSQPNDGYMVPLRFVKDFLKGL